MSSDFQDNESLSGQAGESGPAVSGTGAGSRQASPRPTPTVLTLQDLIALPRQILPEETYLHLQNAGREGLLAIYSLWQSIDKARKGSGGGKVHRHIDVD